MSILAAVGVAAFTVVAPGSVRADADTRDKFDLQYELANYSKTTERQRALKVQDLVARGEHQVDGVLSQAGLKALAKKTFSQGTYDKWEELGGGRTRLPVHWVNPNGAKLSGNLWYVKKPGLKPHSLPGVVVTTGSLNLPEQVYWSQVQALAKAGFMVLTYNIQGYGRSELPGRAADTVSGIPPEFLQNFIRDNKSALDFFFSTPRKPYSPDGKSGQARQKEAVADGSAQPYNPLHRLLDRENVGVAGHSSGAYSGSYLSTVDERIKAFVAWDNLKVRLPFGVDMTGIGAPVVNTDANMPPEPFEPRVPALGISADYGVDGGGKSLTGRVTPGKQNEFHPQPFTALPDPEAKNGGAKAYKKAGVDTMQVNIRGGSHFDMTNDPLFPSSLRGLDFTTWYTVAWFEKYLKHDPAADAKLLTDRWQHDPIEAKIDPNHDGNKFSQYFRSFASLHLENGTMFECADLREGCAGQVPAASDGGPEVYKVVEAR